MDLDHVGCAPAVVSAYEELVTRAPAMVLSHRTPRGPRCIEVHVKFPDAVEFQADAGDNSEKSHVGVTWYALEYDGSDDAKALDN